MTNDEDTRTYRDTDEAKGWSNKAIYRALRRAVAERDRTGLTAAISAAGSDLQDVSSAGSVCGRVILIVSGRESGNSRFVESSPSMRRWRVSPPAGPRGRSRR